jgi:hypothetical protein
MSNAAPPLLYNALEAACPRIQHKEATDTQGGGQASYANFKDTGAYIYVQLADAPKQGVAVGDITLPFGISPIYTGKKGKGNNAPVDPDKKAAYDKRKNVDFGLLPKHVAAMEAFEAWNIKDLAANSEAVYDKKVSEAKIKERWISSLKRPEDDDEEEAAGGEHKKQDKKAGSTYRVRLRTKLNTVGNMAPKVSIMQPNGTRTPGTWEDIDKKRSTCVPILRYSGRWFSSGKVGVTWEISNILIFPFVDEQPEFPFVWNSDSAPPVKDESAVAPPPAKPSDASASAAMDVDGAPPAAAPANGEPVHDYKFEMV